MSEPGDICGGCGHENLPGSQFCEQCGRALLPPELEPATVAAGLRAATMAARRPAGRWQRRVMGLAAVMLLAVAVPYFWLVFEVAPYSDMGTFGVGLGALLVLAGTGFGFAMDRPLCGIMRRLIVGFAILTIVLPPAAGFVIVYFFFVFT